jgi:hypothetical protein
MPVAGIDIVLHDDTGAVVSSAKTDGTGKATLEPTSDRSAVTLLELDAGGQHNATTRMAIEPGDSLVFVIGPYPQRQPFSADLEITIPPNPPAGTNYLWVDFGCEAFGTQPGSTFTHQLMNDCRRTGTNNLDAIVYAQNGDERLAYAVMPNVTVASPTPISFQSWRTDWLELRLEYVGISTAAIAARTGFTFEVAGNRFTDDRVTLPITGGTVSRTERFVSGLATHIQHRLELSFGDGPMHGTTSYSRFAAITPSYTLDASRLPPPITTLSIADATTARPTVSWTAAGSHENSSYGFVTLSWAAPASGGWSLMFPPDLDDNELTVPALPDELAAFRPPADGSITADAATAGYQWSSWAPTYADNRERQDGPEGEFEVMTTYFPGFF